jgi:hypothetical protein
VVPVTVTEIFPPLSSVTDAFVNVIPVTFETIFVPSPTWRGLPPPPLVNPVIKTFEPSLLFSVNSPNPLL